MERLDSSAKCGFALAIGMVSSAFNRGAEKHPVQGQIRTGFPLHRVPISAALADARPYNTIVVPFLLFPVFQDFPLTLSDIDIISQY